MSTTRIQSHLNPLAVDGKHKAAFVGAIFMKGDVNPEPFRKAIAALKVTSGDFNDVSFARRDHISGSSDGKHIRAFLIGKLLQGH